MNTSKSKTKTRHWESGRVRAGVLLWALGVPLPIILIVMLVRGC